MHGKGWHVPGGIIRYKERFEERINRVAQKEIGAALRYDSVPIAINQIITDNNSRESEDHVTRGHFISFLFNCRLDSGFVPKNTGLKETDNGFLKWHLSCPTNLIKAHEIYRNLI